MSCPLSPNRQYEYAQMVEAAYNRLPNGEAGPFGDSNISPYLQSRYDIEVFSGENITGANWDVVYEFTDKQTGQTYLAGRGTDDKGDVGQYPGIGLGFGTSLGQQMADMANDIFQSTGNTVIVLGHSYAGHGAEEAALKAPDAIEYAVNYQGPSTAEFLTESAIPIPGLTPLGMANLFNALHGNESPSTYRVTADENNLTPLGGAQFFLDFLGDTFNRPIDMPIGVPEHDSEAVQSYYESFDLDGDGAFSATEEQAFYAAHPGHSCKDNRTDTDAGGRSAPGNWFSNTWDWIQQLYSPLVVDLDGDGIELVALENSTAFFDLNIDGYAQHTGWVSSDDGILALDLNSNGYIDDNSELFGNMTGYQNGFLQLETHDENGDGVISQADSVFSSLLIWQDFNQDGFSNSDELTSLSEAGIHSIDLGSVSISEYNSGHWVSDRSSVTLADGSNGIIEDVHFENDQTKAFALTGTDFQYDPQAVLLPTLWGMAQIPSTWVALTLDTTLKQQSLNLLTQLEAGDISGFRSDFDAFLLAWAGVTDIQENSRGANVNAQHLKFMELALGKSFMQDGSFNPEPDAGRELEDLFDQLADQLAGRFLSMAATSQALIDALASGVDNYQGHLDALDNVSANHPLLAFSWLSVTSTPDQPELSGDVTDFVSELAVQVDSGALTPENALLALSLVQQDLQPDVSQFKADAVAGALAAGLDPQAEFVFLIESFENLEVVSGTIVNDTLVSDGDRTFFVGGAGDDAITGSDAGNIFYGGLGNDTLIGGDDADMYIYRLGDGNDVISDWDDNHRNDKLLLADVLPADVTFLTTAEDDLVITFSNNETIRIVDQFTEDQHKAVELIEFSDGTILDRSSIRDKSVADQKASGVVRGSDLPENYYHTLGDGSYTIYDWDNNGREDRLILTDTNAQDASFLMTHGDDLVISFSNGEQVTFTDHFEEADDETLEVVQFADGSELNLQGIRNKSVADQKGNGSGIVRGSDFSETYSHALGDGSYTIYDWDNNGREDRLVLIDSNVSDVQFASTSGEDLTITFTNGDVILFSDHFEEANDETLEVVEFADGSQLNLQGIRNKSVADQKDNGSGIVRGSDFSETYYHALGDGSYEIHDWDNNGRQDRLVFTNLNADDVSFKSDQGESLVITMSNGETIKIVDHFEEAKDESIEVIEFADGTELGFAAIRNKSVADQVPSGSVLGSDYVETYYHTSGDGSYTVHDWDNNKRTDVFIFNDVNSTDVTIQRLESDNDDVVFTLLNGDQITFNEQARSDDVWGIEEFVFADGVTMTRHQVEIAPILDDDLIYL